MVMVVNYYYTILVVVLSIGLWSCLMFRLIINIKHYRSGGLVVYTFCIYIAYVYGLFAYAIFLVVYMLYKCIVFTKMVVVGGALFCWSGLVFW
jgi:hypothetical protein